MRNVAVAILAVCALALAAAFLPALAAESPVHFAAGVNGAWMDGADASLPADLEAGGTAWSSLSPHFSLTAAAFYGFSNSYIRWQTDWRASMTDVDNPNLNTYAGIRLRGGSTRTVGPTEWAPVVGVGWRPLPDTYDNLTIGADAGYGIDSQKLLLTLAGRWEFRLP